MITTDKDREKIAREIAKTSESIRKKYRALKTGKMAEDVALERHFKPIVEPLRKIAENTIGENDDDERLSPNITALKNETLSPHGAKREKEDAPISERSKKRSKSSTNESLITTPPNHAKRRRFDISSNVLPITSTPTTSVVQPITLDNDVFETSNNDSIVTSLRHQLQTPEGENVLRDQLGPLGQAYIGAILREDRNSSIDYVYGVYFHHGRTMLGDKHFDVDKNDNMIIDGIRYVGTPGLYELIFKRIPDDMVYTEDDKQKYKSILLTTNAHRRDHSALNPILGNRGYKYKNIIAPLLSDEKKRVGRGLPRTMALTDNDIDYVHWNDPNELVDRLRLLDASRHAGNNAHDNEILSIIEELREAGLIIN